TTPSTWSPTPATRRPRTTSPASSPDPPLPDRPHRPGCGRRIRPRSDAGPAISILRPKRSGWGRSEPEGMFRTSAPTAPPTPPTAAPASAPGGRPDVAVAPVLRARRLAKTHAEQSPATRALDGVDLDTARADSLAIMGPSGCGKTTLLHVLAGILQPSSGAVDLNGTDLATLSDRRRTRLRREDFGF